MRTRAMVMMPLLVWAGITRFGRKKLLIPPAAPLRGGKPKQARCCPNLMVLTLPFISASVCLWHISKLDNPTIKCSKQKGKQTPTRDAHESTKRITCTHTHTLSRAHAYTQKKGKHRIIIRVLEMVPLNLLYHQRLLCGAEFYTPPPAHPYKYPSRGGGRIKGGGGV